MKSEIKDEWVKRLRSGDYRQGRYHLHSEMPKVPAFEEDA